MSADRLDVVGIGSMMVDRVHRTPRVLRADEKAILRALPNAGPVALFTGAGTRHGRTLDNPTALVIRMAAGRLAEVHEFVWDLYQVDEFWS